MLGNKQESLWGILYIYHRYTMYRINIIPWGYLLGCLTFNITSVCLEMEYNQVYTQFNYTHYSWANFWDSIFQTNPFVNICNDNKIIEHHLPGHSCCSMGGSVRT